MLPEECVSLGEVLRLTQKCEQENRRAMLVEIDTEDG